MNQNDRHVDRIHIEQLEIFAHIGVPEEERASAQRLTLTISLWPRGDFANLNDQLARTVDYAAVCQETRDFVQQRSDRLIETLADAVAKHLLDLFQVQKITVELRKFIMPGVQYVSVTVTRNCSSN